MNLNFFNTKDKGNTQMTSFLDSFVNELKNVLNNNEILVIDKIEENIVTCENQYNGEMIDIPRNLVTTNVTEGMTIKFIGDKYVIDYENCILSRKNLVDEIKNTWEREEGVEYYIVSSIMSKAIKCSNIYIKQNIYVKDENIIKEMKKGDIVKLVDGKYIIDREKNIQINNKIKEMATK